MQPKSKPRKVEDDLLFEFIQGTYQSAKIDGLEAQIFALEQRVKLLWQHNFQLDKENKALCKKLSVVHKELSEKKGQASFDCSIVHK